MSIFTVFFCGTGSNSEDNNHKNYVSGELISTLAKNTTGRDMIDYIKVDWVGSGNQNEWLKQGKDDMYSGVKGTLLGKGIDSAMCWISCAGANKIKMTTWSEPKDCLVNLALQNQLGLLQPTKSIKIG
jgi:hypothetical protein